MLRQQDFNKAHIVLAAWRETKEYGGHQAGVMVMNCLMNRVKLGWGAHLEIVQKIPQFHFSLTPLSSKSDYPSIWEPAFVRLLHEIDAVYDGSGIDTSKGAVYWADLRYITNPWFKENILGKPDAHPRIADFNSLTFFR